MAVEDAAEARLCSIWLEGERTIMLMPCRHLCMCADCAGKVRECPLCREKVTRRVPVFV